jgi:hypothetical protein
MPRLTQSTTTALTGTQVLGGAGFPLRRLALAVPRVRVTRRTLQVVLGLLWFLDGVLQLQPFMLRASFARDLLAAVGDGQPQFVAGPVHWAANLVAAHPVAWDVPFATVQLLLGVGMLVPRTARLALAASLPWALGVWWLGEGLSGLASGNASLLSGAPGSVSVYAVLALAAWPRRGRSDVPPARWLPLAWATLWVGAAVLQVLPMNNTGADVSSAMLANGSPSWLAGFESSFAGWITHHGTLSVVLLVAAEALIGLAVLYRRTIAGGAAAGLLLAIAIWVIGQNFGALYTGQATDPNTAPLVMLMAVALLAGYARPREAADRLWRRELMPATFAAQEEGRRAAASRGIEAQARPEAMASSTREPADRRAGIGVALRRTCTRGLAAARFLARSAGPLVAARLGGALGRWSDLPGIPRPEHRHGGRGCDQRRRRRCSRLARPTRRVGRRLDYAPRSLDWR